MNIKEFFLKNYEKIAFIIFISWFTLILIYVFFYLLSMFNLFVMLLNS